FDVVLLALTVWAFLTRVSTTPAADFCRTVRVNLSTLSHDSVTCSRSPEISSIAFHAQPPNLRFASLIDMGFAIIGPLARRSRLRSGSCTLARAFAPRFLQTPPRGDAPAFRYPSPSIGLGRGLPPPSRRTCSAYQKRPRCDAPEPPIPSNNPLNAYPLKISVKIITSVNSASVSTNTSPRIMEARIASAAPGFRAMPSQAEDPIFDCA